MPDRPDLTAPSPSGHGRLPVNTRSAAQCRSMLGGAAGGRGSATAVLVGKRQEAVRHARVARRGDGPTIVGHNPPRRAQMMRSSRYTGSTRSIRTHRRATPPMATDYDAPRKTDDDLSEDSIEELKSRRVDKSSSSVDVDETEQAEGFELPGADLSGEELSVRVLPRQADEFTCSRCFLVHHRSQLAKEVGGQMVCRECAA